MAVDALATQAAQRGVRPDVVWHSGKLRARQTAEAFWRECNALAAFSATRDLQPDDPPGRIRDRLAGENRDVLIAGHFPFLPKLLALLTGKPDGSPGEFPAHGLVALASVDDLRWKELWRLSNPKTP